MSIMAKHWNTGMWKGKRNWECKHCEYATLDKEAMETHYQDEHAPTPRRKEPVNVTIYDRFGNPITEREV